MEKYTRKEVTSCLVAKGTATITRQEWQRESSLGRRERLGARTQRILRGMKQSVPKVALPGWLSRVRRPLVL